MIYDVIIIGGGASGLFTSIFSPKEYSKLILEKNKTLGTKILLSGGERANITNIDIDPTNDYFGQNKKAMLSILSKFSQWDCISFFEKNKIATKEEDRGRIILESGNSRELLDFLSQKSQKNNTNFQLNSKVVDIQKKGDIFEIILDSKEKLLSKKVVVSVGGKSFSHVGTSGDGYKWAQKMGIDMSELHRGLCGLTTQKDLSTISGITANPTIQLVDKTNSKIIYTETGPLLFTHFGLSGPIIFNTAISLGEYLNTFKNLAGEERKQSYIQKNIYIKIIFDINNTPKRLINFFDINGDENTTKINLKNYRTWKEAKVTGGGILLDCLDKNLQSKKYKNLYFVGEILDLTGKTGGFNLQLSWSTGYIVGKDL